MSLPAFLEVRGDDLEIRVKAVPGARRDGLAGALGDRLKIRVAAPPEGGRANDAIRSLLARAIGVPERRIELVAGPASPQKVFRVRESAPAAAAVARMLLASGDGAEAPGA